MSTSNLRTRLIPLAIVAALACAGVFFALERRRPADHDTGTKQLYTCGMHPQIIQDKPGNCPICGMKLTPIRKQPDAVAAVAATAPRKVKFYKSTMLPGEVSPAPAKDSMGMDMVPVYEEAAAADSTITIDPVTIQTMGLRTGAVIIGPLKRDVRTVGVIDFDETALTDVTTKFKGWIEKLYVDSTGQQVHRGDALFEIYSPDIYSAQTEYLLALRQTASVSGPAGESLRASALTKLRFYDVPDAQIAELEKTRQPMKTVRINAPRDGIVVEKLAVAGQMVDAGMKLYRLADLATVWVQAQVYEQDLAFVQVGQEAVMSLSYLPDRKFRGRVTYVYPTVDDKTRTARVRMEFHNPGLFLKPGMFATVQLESELDPAALLVPDSAILRGGEQNTVFVALDGGRFEPRTVTLGPRSEDNFYQVLAGLKEGERVVTSGQFMLDSESQLREAIQKMSRPGAPAPPPASAPPLVVTNASSTANALAFALASKRVAYICPMPEHAAIQYDHPGKCPLCGMTLIPVPLETLAKMQASGVVDYYTCPMTDACPSPGHGAIKYDKPGQCPVCGMTLIPVFKAPAPQSPTAGAEGTNAQARP